MISAPTAAGSGAPPPPRCVSGTQSLGSIARMRQQIDDHRADRRHRRALIALDERQHGHRIPARHHHDRRAVADAGVHVARHPGDVKIRQHRHHPAAGGVRAAPHRRRPRRGLHAAMRVHAAFRPSRRARRVQQQRHVVTARHDGARRPRAPERVVPRDEFVTMQRRARRGHRGRQGEIRRPLDVVGIRGDDEVMHGSGNVGCEFRRKLLSGDRDRRAAVVDVRLKLFGDEHRVERDHDGVRAQNRVIRDHVLRRVLHEEQHAVSALHARFMLEVAGEPLDLVP